MSTTYRAVRWNRQKRLSDTALLGIVALLLLVLIAGGSIVNPNATVETLLIRAFGLTALVLLHGVLSIGPLCRLDRRLLPLLYNRRHLGVTTFGLALAHGTLATVQFHGFGDRNPLASLLTTSSGLFDVSAFPFQLLGLAALSILFLLAATSHDFWLRMLTPAVWKGLHMVVYAAYALGVLHVALGALQSERSPVLAGTLVSGVLWIGGLHAMAAARERRIDDDHRPTSEQWVDVCGLRDLTENRGIVARIGRDRVAVFKHAGGVSALSNVWRHQNGPLGEGRIVNGCVVCPWHGYEYRPDTGASPPPFTDRVETYSVRICGGRVLVDPRPHAPGTFVEPARIA